MEKIKAWWLDLFSSNKKIVTFDLIILTGALDRTIRDEEFPK